MSRKYAPLYQKGEIYVCFKEGDPEHARIIGKVLGYELFESNSPEMHNVFSFKVEKGKEKEAVKNFYKYPEFVEWAERIDLRFKKRSFFKDHLEDMVNQMDEDLSEEMFSGQLEYIKQYIEKFKDFPEEDNCGCGHKH